MSEFTESRNSILWSVVNALRNCDQISPEQQKLIADVLFILILNPRLEFMESVELLDKLEDAGLDINNKVLSLLLETTLEIAGY